MTEIPEHLRKRAAEARAKAESADDGAAAAPAPKHRPPKLPMTHQRVKRHRRSPHTCSNAQRPQSPRRQAMPVAQSKLLLRPQLLLPVVVALQPQLLLHRSLQFQPVLVGTPSACSPL